MFLSSPSCVVRTYSIFSSFVFCSIQELNFIYFSLYQLIDERSKQYSSAGDDKVNQTITDLVRGALASGVKQMLEQVQRDQKLRMTCNCI